MDFKQDPGKLFNLGLFRFLRINRFLGVVEHLQSYDAVAFVIAPDDFDIAFDRGLVDEGDGVLVRSTVPPLGYEPVAFAELIFDVD